MGGLLFLAPLLAVLSVSLTSVKGASECYACGNCTGTTMSFISTVFDKIGEDDEVDQYVQDVSSFADLGLSACPANNDDFTNSHKESLEDTPADGTKCMTMFFTIKDGTTVTNDTTNVVLSCTLLSPVASIFGDSAMNLSATDYKKLVNAVTVAGLQADLETLNDEGGVDDATGGILICSGDACNTLPVNDYVEITSTLETYDEDFEDDTSQSYANLVESGELIAETMCESLQGSCSKSGFKGFKKVAASSKRQRRSTYHTQVLIFIETMPGTTPSDSEITSVFQAALVTAQATSGNSLLDSFSNEITIVVTEGGVHKSGSMNPRPASMTLLALLCLLGIPTFV